MCFFIFLSAFCQKKDIFSFFLSKREQNLDFLHNNSFRAGERLKYKISYGKKNKKGGVLFAAYATFEVKDSIIHKNTPAYYISGFGKTTRVFSLFMKVRHSYSSILAIPSLKTLESKMNIREGGHYDYEHIMVDQDSALQASQANDILGAFYKLRAIPQQKIENIDTLFFSYYYNNNIYQTHVINLGKDTIKTKFGHINTIKYAPKLEQGRMFKENSQAIVWVTDNDLHIPIKLEIPILVGSIYVNLLSYNKVLFNLNE